MKVLLRSLPSLVVRLRRRAPIDSSPPSLYVLTEGVSCIPEEERSSLASSLPEVEWGNVGGSKSSLLLVPL